MLFPNPTSSRVLVRKSLAAVNSEIGHIFASEIESLLFEDANIQNRAGEGSDRSEPGDIAAEKGTKVQDLEPKEQRTKAIALRVLAVAVRGFNMFGKWNIDLFVSGALFLFLYRRDFGTLDLLSLRPNGNRT